MSRFESNLHAWAAAEPDELRKSIYNLRLAAYWARTGALQKSRDTVSMMRRRFGEIYSAQLFAHINFSEAMCDFVEHGVERALPKISRSRALCEGCPADDPLPAVVSAWLAHFYRVLGAWDRVAIELAYSFAWHGAKDCSEARTRAGLVIADCLQDVEEYETADHWYGFARRQSLMCGDDSLLSAVLYNRAAIRVFNLRINEVENKSILLNECQIVVEAASAENYSSYTNNTAMLWVFNLLEGQLSMLRGDRAKALKMLDAPSVQGLERSWPAVDLVRRCDILRCKAALGELDQSEFLKNTFVLEPRLLVERGRGDVAVAARSISSAAEVVVPFAAGKYSDMSQHALDDFLLARLQEKNMVQSLVKMIDSSSGT